MRREHMIRVRASDEELSRLVALAQASGLSLSAYLRLRGLQNSTTARRQNSRASRVTGKTRSR